MVYLVGGGTASHRRSSNIPSTGRLTRGRAWAMRRTGFVDFGFGGGDAETEDGEKRSLGGWASPSRKRRAKAPVEPLDRRADRKATPAKSNAIAALAVMAGKGNVAGFGAASGGAAKDACPTDWQARMPALLPREQRCRHAAPGAHARKDQRSAVIRQACCLATCRQSSRRARHANGQRDHSVPGRSPSC